MVTLVNRAKMTTATTGTGTLTLGSAVDGYQTFADAGVSNADVVSYAIEDGTAWEIGTGTYTASGTTLSRTVSESSNAGAAINLSGNAVVFVTARAEDLATGGGAPTLATSSGASQSVDFSTSNKIHVATIDEDATLTFTNPASVAKLDLILDVKVAGYSLSSASYSSLSFSVASQTTDLICGTLSDDGTKLYVVGGSTTIYQYSLSTPNDISTASYDSVFLNLGTTYAQGIKVSPDGTKLFVASFQPNAGIIPYTLSTPFAINTATYDGSFLDTSGQDGLPRSVDFSGDGTKLFLAGQSNSSIYSYTLLTAYDLTTATYDGLSLSVASQDTRPYEVSVSPDGSKLVVLGDNSNSAFEYALSTPYNLSTASYSSVSFSFDTQAPNSSANGLIFDAVGGKMYMLSSNNSTGPKNTVFQYSTEGSVSVVLPDSLKSASFTLVGSEKTALAIVTYDGGTTYQAINVQGGIV